MEYKNNPPTGSDNAEPLELLVDERELRLSYANSFRIKPTAEEVIVDVGFNMPNPNSNPGGGNQILFKVSERLVMSYGTAARLGASLHQILKNREMEIAQAAGRNPVAVSEEIKIRRE